jgi:sugar phosphate isomerase/epimerase
MTRVGVQVYSVKDSFLADIPATMDGLAGLGVAGVELFTLGEPGRLRPERLSRARAMAQAAAAAGLVVVAAHTNLPALDDSGWVFEEVSAAGARLGLAASPDRVLGFSKDAFDDRERLLRFAERLNALAVVAAGHGLKVGYHNHWFEWGRLDGGPEVAYDAFVDALDPSVVLEIDLLWAAAGGQDLPALLRRHASRVQLVHVKDSTDLTPGTPQVAAGTGVAGIGAALDAAGDALAWHVLEVDLVSPGVEAWGVLAAGVRWLKERSATGEAR